MKNTHGTLHPKTLRVYEDQVGMMFITISGMDILVLLVYCYLLHDSQETSPPELTRYLIPHDQNQGIPQFYQHH